MRRATATGVMLFVAHVVAGCSWTAVRPANVPSIPRDDDGAANASDPSCTRSLALPITDTVLASAYVALGTSATVSLATGSDCHEVRGFNDDPVESEVCSDANWAVAIAPILAVAAVATALHTGSAVYGYRKTAECRELAR